MIGSIIKAASSYGAGQQQIRASKALERQAQLDAKSAEVEITRELVDAMAMQNLMVGASGSSAGVGSAKTILEDSLSEFGKDRAMIRAVGKSRASGIRAKGRSALSGAIGTGIAEAGLDYYRNSQIGGRS